MFNKLYPYYIISCPTAQYRILVLLSFTVPVDIRILPEHHFRTIMEYEES